VSIFCCVWVSSNAARSTCYVLIFWGVLLILVSCNSCLVNMFLSVVRKEINAVTVFTIQWQYVLTYAQSYISALNASHSGQFIPGIQRDRWAESYSACSGKEEYSCSYQEFNLRRPVGYLIYLVLDKSVNQSLYRHGVAQRFPGS